MPGIIRKFLNCFLVISYILYCVSRTEGQESYASSNPHDFVPTVKQNNYEVVSSKDKYRLRIDFLDGSSRGETVELVSDENGRKVPKVEGFFTLVYKNAPFIVTVKYQADEKGYRARYMYGRIPIELKQYASVNLLKSAAG